MTNFLTRKGGQPITNQLPLQVDDVNQASDRISISAETVTFASAAAAAAPGVNALDRGPILNLTGDKVGSYWGEAQNLMMTYQNQAGTLLGAVTETAASASIVITDVNNALDTLYETTSGNRRYIIKLIDVEGDVLYGWIGNITVSGNAYTIPAHDLVTSGAQSWVGTLADFTTVQRVEIYSYQSSFVWVTGTVLLREVALDEEMVQTAEGQRKYYASLSNGDYGINYRTGAIYFKKATTGTSDTCNYDTIASPSISVTSSGATSTLVDDAAFTVATSIVTPVGYLADETTPDSVDEGDTGAARMTLDRRQITAGQTTDDAAPETGTRVNMMGGLFDDVTTDAVDEGDAGFMRISADRKLIPAGAYIDDSIFTPAGVNSYVMMMGAEADETATDIVDEGDAGALRMTTDRRLITAGQILDDAVFGVATAYVTPVGYLADETGTDSVDEGDVGIPRMTLNRRPIDAGHFLDDSVFGIATDYVSASGFLADDVGTDLINEGDIGIARITTDRKQIMANNFTDDAPFVVAAEYVGAAGFLADDTATDSVDEGDIGVARMSLDRKQLIAGSYVDDVAFTPAGANSYVVMMGAQADETTPDSVDEGDAGALRMTLTRFLKTSMGDLISGEDQTNTVMQVVEKPLAVSTYTPDLDTSSALEASSVTKASAGVLYGCSFSNTNAATRYLQFFNSTTVPGDATVPVLEFAVAAESTLTVEWAKGRYFSTGIAWCNSSTNGAKTIGAADSLNDVNYK